MPREALWGEWWSHRLRPWDFLIEDQLQDKQTSWEEAQGLVEVSPPRKLHLYHRQAFWEFWGHDLKPLAAMLDLGQSLSADVGGG